MTLEEKEGAPGEGEGRGARGKGKEGAPGEGKEGVYDKEIKHKGQVLLVRVTAGGCIMMVVKDVRRDSLCERQ